MWPSFNQIFLMIYLAVWMRRSNVLTGAEWIRTRFGNGRGAELSHISVVIFAIISVIGFLAYAFQGIGKFSAVFLPWDLDPNTYAMIFMGITTVYVMLGGLYSVVLTDLIQFVILTVASIAIGVIAMSRVNAPDIAAAVPPGWDQIGFGWRLDLDWSNHLAAVNATIGEDGYALFGFFMMMVFKGVLASIAGPTPSYDMQRVLATRTPREAALMSGLVSVVLYLPRYFMIAGITVLGLVFFSGDLAAMGDDVDFEQILPYVISNFVPVGVMGFLLAGLLAAFMSTFDSTVNAGAAYLVNDVYKRYINPNATTKRYIKMSYLSSALLVVVGIAFGMTAQSINGVLQWMVGGLYGGFAAANVLKWHWWRLNGHGYFTGMVTGIILALAFPTLFPKLSALNGFPFILIISGLAAVLVSLKTDLSQEEEESLKSFYRNVRPWGFWRPIEANVLAETPDFRPNKDFKRDASNLVVGVAWHTMLAAIPIFLVIRQYPRSAFPSASSL
ncbi:MAG: SSS family solute:Na+ symporter [Verrucomicrobiales bacterium]